MIYCTKVKTRNLSSKLLSLDIDEGLRIESTVQGIRLFINRSASGTFVLQICNNKDDKENRNNNLVYFDSAEEVIKLIKMKFGRNFSVWSY
ncbi:MAG TPA: hypothetical protein VKA87_06625 [Nitrososphaeraceae archaeon]|nr:hypothetical protein [Nitrososphaeraceae archaeon]